MGLLSTPAQALGLSPDLVGALAELRAAQRRTLLAQQLELAEVHGLLAASGIGCLVIKGLPLAVQTTGDAGGRGPGDIDLLVAPEAVAEVDRILTDRGWSMRPDGTVRPGTWAWRHVLRNANSLTYLGPGSSIDLHWRLDSTVDALPAFDELWARRVRVGIGGSEVDTLALPDALAQSALHAAKDRWRWLRSLVDVHRLAAMPELWEQVDASRLHRLEITSLAVTEAGLGLPAAVPAAVRQRIGRTSQRPVRRALRDQELPPQVDRAAPGVESALSLRYLVTASTTPRDLTRSVVAMSLPLKVVSGIDSRTGWTGVPRAWWRRVVRLRRRTAAWVRRQPPAEQIVRTP